MDQEEAQTDGEPAVLCSTAETTDGSPKQLHQTGR